MDKEFAEAFKEEIELDEMKWEAGVVYHQEFKNGDKVVDINNLSNLCASCPNCHYGKDTLKDPKILGKVLIHSVLVSKILTRKKHK